jgi:hypothetical protein
MVLFCLAKSGGRVVKRQDRASDRYIQTRGEG